MTRYALANICAAGAIDLELHPNVANAILLGHGARQRGERGIVLGRDVLVHCGHALPRREFGRAIVARHLAGDRAEATWGARSASRHPVRGRVPPRGAKDTRSLLGVTHITALGA
eukprot:CAMPEP_0198521902 /NCGR_PEP_ID=MMETSP1462-20131121/21218_1 /TAXON_ID=1333877 /ORGANISM="Brandtodinium nutriculum, Strain RCC3387" /LENGTH=114 /DNA_ID=CAMNT_0044251557 /DNA_START=112 /DNA_END=453 /DNA_ORIENTATION=-